jgi:hypothetical protein
MSRFVAIPVAQGDAFFLDHRSWSVLVDGGRSINSFSTVFQNSTHVDSVDVLVCTHNDADHANGVIGFLESALQCHEVWLPGRWLRALPEVLRPFIDVSQILAHEIVQNPKIENLNRAPGRGATALEQYADLSPELTSMERLGEPLETGDDGWTEGLHGILERAESWQSYPFESIPYPDDLVHPDYPGVYGLTRPTQWELLWSAIEAADKIRRIAIAAFHQGIRVRWFQYDPLCPTGIGGAQLQPLNARLIARVQR